jgi:endonuclease/exonuclease/phosphatase family metal-dependent hydrolase
MSRPELWIENLKQFQTLEDLYKSAFFADSGQQIESYLRTPEIITLFGTAPVLTSFLRVVQWNIEKGKRLDGILDCLKRDEVARWADVVILNEADRGMNRSQNRHIVRHLAEQLDMNMVFAPAHFELTKGTGEELTMAGDNAEGIQGNAILSRYPVLAATTVLLPSSFEPYEFEEKRFGWRNCLWVKLQLKGGCLWIGSVHLELRNTPRCRAVQMRHIMEHLPGTVGDAYLLGGDLNTNSFSRGTPRRTVSSIFRLLSGSASRTRKKLLHPEQGGEPLFKVLEYNGFSWQGLNAHEETARAAIDSLEESGLLPGFVASLIQKRLESYNGYLCFKLDWLLGKNIIPLSSGQKRDIQTGVASRQPGCLKVENAGPSRISDHLPIYADIDLAAKVSGRSPANLYAASS